MARMIPEGGPTQNESFKAEPDVYWRLAKLDDDFTVIHSLPWLCAAVKTIDKNYAPTGEIDFVVLHPRLGILTIEVKGGVFKYDRHKFVYLRTNQQFDPIGQSRRGTFALSKLLSNVGINIQVGYAWIFPEIDMKHKPIPLAFQDIVQDIRLAIDKRDLPDLPQRICSIMEYWQKTLKNPVLPRQEIDKIVDLICPSSEYGVGWDARVEYDNKTWLTLNSDQRRNLKRILEIERTVVSGRAGTGKTILAIALARYLSTVQKRVLFLFYNSPIANKISNELSDSPNVHVLTFHKLCRRAELNLGISSGNLGQEWFEIEAPSALSKALSAGKMESYDVLIIDEGQIFQRDWYSILCKWIKCIHVFCDETQVFPHETGLFTEELVEKVLDADYAGILTVNMRSPKTVFDRLDIVFPTNYEQHSPREYEQDTLQEIVSFDTVKDLWRLLRQLKNEGIEANSIAVITTKRQLEELGKSDKLDSLRQLAGLIDTSTRVRGLEFPIVIVFELNTSDTSHIANAYARATTRVIALYSIWSFGLVDHDNLEQRPFLAEILKNPEVVNALNDPWNYAIDNLGWQLIPVTSKLVHIFWNQGLNAWVIHCKENLKLSEELWINHLLVSTEFSVYVVISFQGLLRLSLYQTSEKSYVATPKHLTVRIAFCDKCDRLAIEIEDEGVICSYCNGEKSYALPLAQREILQFDNIISNPRAFSDQQRQRVGLSLIALLAINKLSEDDRTFLYDHVSRKLTKRLGYRPLLILTGIDLLRSAQGASISIDSLLKKYKKWIDVIHHKSIEKVLTNCLAYWLQKKWLKKVSTGFYLTLDVTNDVNTTD